MAVEIVPAILRKTFEATEQDWQKIYRAAQHIQIDVTDGIFAGDGTWDDVTRFKLLPEHEKIELHMMVHTPANYADDVIALAPARCIFHIEAFAHTNEIQFLYQTVREKAGAEMGLAINPSSPNEWL